MPGRAGPAQPPAPSTVPDILRSPIAVFLLLLGALLLLDLLFRALVLLLLPGPLLRALPHPGARTHASTRTHARTHAATGTHARSLPGWHVGQPHATFGSALLHLFVMLLAQRLALLDSLQAAHLVAIRPALGRSHQLGTLDLIPLHHAGCWLAERCGLAAALAATLV
jgi:hypothetical protein